MLLYETVSIFVNMDHSDYIYELFIRIVIPHLQGVTQDSPDCGSTWEGSGCNIRLVAETTSFEVLGSLVN